MNEDVLDRLATYRPTDASIAAEWSAPDRARVRSGLFDDQLQLIAFRARRPRRMPMLAPVAASVAVLAAIGGAVAVSRLSSHDGTSHGALSGGSPTSYAQLTLSDQPAVGEHAYEYRAVHSFNVLADGTASTANDETDAFYLAGNGDFAHIDASACSVYPHSGSASFSSPTTAFIASLPTEVAQLRQYMLAHVSGSASVDEAVFVAVGDLLRYADELASPRLRAAFVDVLSQSHVITVHPGDHDYLGRPAIRVDYTDQQRRAGELDSMYFDPDTFQLLEERNGSNGQPSNAPSTLPWSATPAAGTGTPLVLTGPAHLLVMTSEKVVDTLPASCQR